MGAIDLDYLINKVEDSRKDAHGRDPLLYINFKNGSSEAFVMTQIRNYYAIGGDLSFGNNFLLNEAALRGYLHIVKFLVDNGVDPSSGYNSALSMAKYAKQEHVVEYLLADERVSPSSDLVRLMVWGAKYKSEDALRVLVKEAGAHVAEQAAVLIEESNGEDDTSAMLRKVAAASRGRGVLNQSHSIYHSSAHTASL